MIKEFINERRHKGEEFTPYLGIDATASSLHVGHLIPMLAIRQFPKAYILIGTDTAMVGDPTGKNTQRSKLSAQTVTGNRNAIAEQIAHLLPNAVIVANAPFCLEDVSDFISVNRLSKYEIFKGRMDEGNNLSLSEFLYPVRQACDFLHLHRERGVNLQIGGSDQYTNILAGIDLIRAVDSRDVFGMTTHLLAAKSGRKISKSEGGAVYLTDEPFNIWQFFRNIRDEDILAFSDVMPTEVPAINRKKIEIATSMTTWICGEESARWCETEAKRRYD